jgi:hypothetical protein
LQLAIQTNCDCYITIVDVDAEGNINLLFPNDAQGPKFYPKGKVRSGEAVLIPDSLIENNTAGFHFDYVTPVGINTIRVFATTDLETAEMIRRSAHPAQTPEPKLEMEEHGSHTIAVATGRLEELKSGLRTRAVKAMETISQENPSSGQNEGVPAGSFRQEDSSVGTVSFQGSDWTATSVTVIVDPS